MKLTEHWGDSGFDFVSPSREWGGDWAFTGSRKAVSSAATMTDQSSSSSSTTGGNHLQAPAAWSKALLLSACTNAGKMGIPFPITLMGSYRWV